MRVLFVNSHVDKGGGQAIQTLQLFRALRPHVDGEFLVLTGSGVHQDLLREPGVRPVGAFRYPQGIESLRRAIRSATGQFDLVHVNDLYFGLPAAYLARAYPRVVLFGTDPVQELGWRYGPGVSGLFRVSLPVLLDGSTLVTNSEPLGDAFRQYSPVVIPNGIDTGRFARLPSRDRARDELGWEPAERVVLYVGKVIPVKRVEWLLEAIQAVPSARLVIVGGYREEFYGDSYYRTLLRTYPAAASRTTFVGEVPASRVDTYLAASDLFAFPSRFEGMPNAVMEAMAAALPVVASDIPAHRALISPGRTGVLVRSGGEMGERIGELLADDASGRRLGEGARAFVRDHLAMEVIRDRYLALYRRLLGE
jgi:glycosyltransferase involved in cell wall biosynthesis